jgi:adenylylsulfate kinase
MAWTIWLTGLPASGKSTLAWRLKRRLGDRGVVTAVLDSDELRPLLAPGASYTAAERDAFYLRLVALAAWLSRQGVNCIIAATGNRRRYRDAARAQLRPFAEVWVRCPRDVCEQRDPKGLYARARGGSIRDVPGIDVPYEPPLAPDLVVDTSGHDPSAAVEAILTGIAFLEQPLVETHAAHAGPTVVDAR